MVAVEGHPDTSNVQSPGQRFSDLVKEPGRSRQKSEARAGRNFTQLMYQPSFWALYNNMPPASFFHIAHHAALTNGVDRQVKVGLEEKVW